MRTPWLGGAYLLHLLHALHRLVDQLSVVLLRTVAFPLHLECRILREWPPRCWVRRLWAVVRNTSLESSLQHISTKDPRNSDKYLQTLRGDARFPYRNLPCAPVIIQLWSMGLWVKVRSNHLCEIPFMLEKWMWRFMLQTHLTERRYA